MDTTTTEVFAVKLNQLRRIVSTTPHFVEDILQPHKRSLSQPNLSRVLVDQFEVLQQVLLGERNVEGGESAHRPVPTPRRRHRAKHRAKQNVEPESGQMFQSEGCGSSLNSSTTLKSDNHDSNDVVPDDHQSDDQISVDYLPPAQVAPTSISQYVQLPTINKKPSSPKKSSIKSKGQSFKASFLKINRMATNKFLSIRISKEMLRKKLPQVNKAQPSKSAACGRPARPTRSPPPTPILIFRPAAPSPSDTDSEFDVNSELYHDSMQPYEAIYCSVDEDGEDDDKQGEGDQEHQSSAHSTQPTQSISATSTEDEDTDNVYYGISELYSEGVVTDNYYDQTPCDDEAKDRDDHDDEDNEADECIYEELSSNEGTIYEEYLEDNDDDECIYDNVEIVESKNLSADDRKQIKRLHKIHKQMRQFGLNGDEIPVNAGVVKNDRRGSRSSGDLLVRRNETVLILRMEANPPGKWLAKNERSKIGYVDLDNLYFEAESIKAVIKSLQSVATPTTPNNKNNNNLATTTDTN